MTQLKAYVCGPITGYPDGNKPAFDAAAAFLREQTAWKVESPIELDTPEELAATLADEYGAMYWERLAFDLKLIQTIDVLCLLPGWEKSKGARLEVFVGLLMGKVFYTIEPPQLCLWGRGLVREILKENLP